MRLVVGHANPDFDAYASTVAATKLFPGARGVFLGSQNANVRAFHNLHEDFLSFVDLKGLDLATVNSVVMVDTRDPERIGELGAVVTRPGVEVIVYDHHPHQSGDLTDADDRSLVVGATTSILVHEIQARAIALTPLEASLMLLGIHEDTGSLSYPGSTAYDAEAAAFLMASGADVEVLNQFLSRTLDPAQRDLLDQLIAGLRVWDVNGQQIAASTATTQVYVDFAGVLTHYIVEDMGFRVAVVVVDMPDRLQVVARSRLPEVDVGAVMALLGGGGHPQAASAAFRDIGVEEAMTRVHDAFAQVVGPPLRVSDIMSSPVRTIAPQETMLQAGEVMARWGHGGLPVAEGGRLLGLVTRKDVDKAQRHGLAHAPVTGFMSRDIHTIDADVDLGALERLLATKGIGRVPVVADGAVVGIVTRKDVLRAQHGDAYLDRHLAHAHPEASERLRTSIVQQLPPYVAKALHAVGAVAGRESVRAHVVGGFVRDMLLARPNLDIDVVVEGEGIAFAEAAAEALGARVKVHRRFGTAVIVVSRELHIDVASSRAEFYAKPGALPTVEPSSLRQDLFRRDFTINAMAACLEPGCFGQVADPFGGLTDLSDGVVRVLHALSFIDDPTRILRAARFETRFGFAMDESTEQHARRAVELGMLGEVSGARLREELVDVFDESEPASLLARLHDLGALSALLPAGAKPESVIALVHELEVARVALAGMGLKGVNRRIATAAAIAASGTAAGAERYIRHFRFGREYGLVTRALTERGPGILRLISDRRRTRDSRLFRSLHGVPAEVLVIVWARADEQGRKQVARYLTELADMVPSVNGRDLIDMGYTPSEQFTAILTRALDDRLDGKAVGRGAELANLKKIARRLSGPPEGERTRGE